MRPALAVRGEVLGIFVLVAPLLDRFEVAAADVAGQLAAENELAVCGRALGGRMHGAERGFEGEGARAVGAQANHDDLVGRADENFAGEGRAVALKAHAGGGGGEIKPAFVAGDGGFRHAGGR